MTGRAEATRAAGPRVFRLVERLPGGGKMVEHFQAPDRRHALRRIRSIPAQGEVELWDGALLVWRSGGDNPVLPRPQEPRSFGAPT